jgi:hypothetical protein
MERETQMLFGETFALGHAARLALDGADSSGCAKALAVADA